MVKTQIVTLLKFVALLAALQILAHVPERLEGRPASPGAIVGASLDAVKLAVIQLQANLATFG